MTSIASGLTEVQEILLRRAKYTMSIPITTFQKTDTVPHNLGFVPFFDYQFSYDGGITFVPPHEAYPTQVAFNQFVQAYIDATNIYFNWTSSFGTTSSSIITLVIDYKLYITEATK